MKRHVGSCCNLQSYRYYSVVSRLYTYMLDLRWELMLDSCSFHVTMFWLLASYLGEHPHTYWVNTTQFLFYSMFFLNRRAIVDLSRRLPWGSKRCDVDD